MRWILFILVIFANSTCGICQATYVWSTGDGSWGTSTSWLPPRTAPANDDILVFNSGGSHIVTDVPTQTIGSITITGNTSVSLQASVSSKTLTVGNSLVNYFTVDQGSSINVLNNSGILLNIAVNTGSQASIGGSVVMENGTFNVGNNILFLHSSAIPIDRVNGQFSIGSGGTLQFGSISMIDGPTITLPNNIFVAAPTIFNLIMNRTNGVTLGNQNITVSGTTTLTLGDLNTNSAGRIRFSSSATSPVETVNSKIVGFAEMLPRLVGTTLLSFLGFELVSGTTIDVGTITLTRRTGIVGINSFNGFESIAATWDVTTDTEPVVDGRLISMIWYDDFDNGIDPSKQFQVYRYDLGPDWTAIESLLPLQVATNPRITTPVLTTKLTGSWTVADEDNALPIILSHFYGTVNNSGIRLDWTTETEINGDHFELQRLQEFSEEFEAIDKILAVGESNERLTYSYTDKEPMQGQNYYRLKLVDLDGSFEFSKVIMIKWTGLGKPELLVYPNPIQGTLLYITGPQSQVGRIALKNALGVELLTIRASELQIFLPDHQLSVGLYYVEFINQNYRLVKKLIINNGY